MHNLARAANTARPNSSAAACSIYIAFGILFGLIYQGPDSFSVTPVCVTTSAAPHIRFQPNSVSRFSGATPSSIIISIRKSGASAAIRPWVKH